MFISRLFVDPDLLDPSDDFYGMVQLLFHGAVYAYILFQSSNMISEGSELLMLTPYRDIVGTIVLPILGAVPDGAIILFSGSDQLSVGVGALAGSTIMLLTIPWFLAMLAGRVDMAPPKSSKSGGAATNAVDSVISGKLVPKYSGKPSERLTTSTPFLDQLTGTGVSVDASIRRAGIIMVITSISYMVIQIPAFGLHCQWSRCNCDDGDEQCLKDKAHDEKPYAWAGMALSVTLFIGYLIDQFMQGKKDDDGKTARKVEEIANKSLRRGMALDFCVFLTDSTSQGCCSSTPDFELEDLAEGRGKLEFDHAIVKLFNKYNTSKSDTGPEIIDSMEVGQLLTDLHMTGTSLWVKLQEAANKDSLTLPRFSQICWEYVLDQQSPNAASMSMERSPVVVLRDVQEDDDYDEDEELEVPEGMEGKDLSKPAQQREIWKRSLIQMLTGTTIVMFFSDPMCDILSALGDKTNLGAFYVAFVLAPLASNASELLAAYNYAGKKTVKTMTISISTLLGAACMNNTFCLSIFLYKIASADDQVWVFSAETISILAVEWIMFIFTMRQNIPLWVAFVVLTIFPLSILAVAMIEKAGLD
eukprot:TRINITY_DN16384_c0_g1_i1.p1 TRINITY_DN16384_c0_g1~~TRINITY_DN16384_c0_g1_i1.p1  ORF type:complete len:587 (+),score=210.87 TRINITY_DN16384_c0_g1_i1:64-1824(+)